MLSLSRLARLNVSLLLKTRLFTHGILEHHRAVHKSRIVAGLSQSWGTPRGSTFGSFGLENTYSGYVTVRRSIGTATTVKNAAKGVGIKAGEAETNTNQEKESKTEAETSSNKRKTLISDIQKLFRLARPEIKILIAALACLIITSTVTMALPLIIGKIIDTVQPNPLQTQENYTNDNVKDNAKDNANDNTNANDNSKPYSTTWGLQPYQFYTFLAVFFAIGAGANFGRMILLRSAGEKLVARLRSRLFKKILSQDPYFFDGTPDKPGMKTGDLISRLSSDTQIISRTLSGNISDGSRALISGCVGLSMMCYVLWKLTLCMSLIFPPLIVMSLFYGRRVKKVAKTIQENIGAMTKVAEEKLNGLKTIQSLAQQKLVVHDYNQEIKHIFRSSMYEGKLSGIFYSGNGFIGNVTIVGLLVIGTKLIALGELTVGDLSSFMMYAMYTGSSVFGLGNFYSELMKGLGAAERVFELVDLRPRIPPTVGHKVDSVHGDIRLQKIGFSYPARPQSVVLQNFCLTIPRGQNICFVGPSGSGKSSISQLLLRFYEPLEGSVTFNNHNINRLNLNYFRSQIGYVSQEPQLFSGTVRDNIVFGKANCTDQDIEYATTLSNAHGFIQELPAGLDTLVGSPSGGGTQLSGGQRQRISLSRALIRRPDILILDEATSALDSQLEKIVMENLARLSREKHCTIIQIAHRLSTIKNSERIVVLNYNGEIIEDGSFTQLYSDYDSELNKLLKSHDLQ